MLQRALQILESDPTPERVPTRNAHQDAVAADGSVRDTRIVDRDTSDQYAQEIFDAVRAARFRPKFIDGQAVAATGITYREIFWTDKVRD